MKLISKIADIDGEIQELVHESKLPALNKLLDKSNDLYIERIAELEKDMRKFEHAVHNENELLGMQKNQEIRDLEQQAKGCTDGAKACSISFGDAVVIGETELDGYAKDLLRKAKALKAGK
jgi:hypothetical protein